MSKDDKTSGSEPAPAGSLERLVRLSGRLNWNLVCDEMETALPELKSFLETWGRSCGAPYLVFRGQLCKAIIEIYKSNTQITDAAPPCGDDKH